MKGFVFSLDAFLAVGMALTFLAALVSVPLEEAPPVRLHEEALDVVSLLDQEGTLASLASAPPDSQQTLDELVSRVVSGDLGARVEVRAYAYETGSSCQSSCRLAGSEPVNEFCLCSWMNSSQSVPSAPVGVAQRMAYVFSSKQDKALLARAWAWKK